MSIPPLVCSTPPPPDQCEDDKHIDEFDLQYRLSPEDDDENDEYGNYGNFSTFNNFNHSVSNNEDSEQHYEICTEKTDHSIIENTTKHSDSPPNDKNLIDKVNFDDVAIEDLNLKIEEENDLVDQVPSNNSNEDSDAYGITCFAPHIEFPDKSIICTHTNLVTEDNNEENKVENMIPEANDFPLFSKTGDRSPIQFIEQSEGDIGDSEVISQNTTSQCEESIPELKTCDDFDDFEDLKFTTNNNYNTIESAANPWENNEPEDFTFGDFKANFDGSETKHEELHNEEQNNQDEEFGDFDDFKSSVNKQSVEVASPHVTVLNLQSNDNEGQIIESIKNILFNIFNEDLPDSGTSFEGNIESLLGETWHHLKEVDVRQPYIVYWNNSLGQKTLLKALCIDSRNILFGPKWNSLMPKYATTLSGAPLKPQKPTTPSTPQQPDISAEKSKENMTWTDPFTSSGQESNNSDREKTLKDSTPSDLDVFESSITESKLDKIYSSTLSVQPLRHINLPDTHIFTPTDSETPRSKTIHYDRPPVLLPQTMEDHGNNPEKSASKNTNIENSDDYWEFQDFKGTTESAQNMDKKTEETSHPVVNSIPTNAAMTLQSQLLQPVKVEPIMPKLNWPDPGEVKETFDDFSDFISTSNWNNDNPSTVNAKDDQQSSNLIKTLHSHNVEDEFETFQSAPVPALNHIKLDAEALSPETSKFSNQAVHSIPLNTQNLKSDEILTPNTMQNHNNIVMNIPSKASSVNNSILKPINASPSVTRPQQVGQILQPLSLESYSQINWTKPGIDLQNLSSFNPLESLETLKTDSGSSGTSKGASPVHKMSSIIHNEMLDDEIWGDFVSSKPKQAAPKKSQVFPDDDEWTDFVSSPSLSQNSLKTISFNVESNSTMQKHSNQTVSKNNQIALDIPVLNYITPKSNTHGMCVDKHFQNL